MTQIAETYERLSSCRRTAPREDAAISQWIETQDTLEQEISHLEAEALSDVLIKLDLLCLRLKQAHVDISDLDIAQSARGDLERMIA